MSTIKVRKQSLDRLGLKTAYLLYNELSTVRLMVNCWYDGDRADLHKKEYAQFLRRLVVRALKEMCASETHDFYSKVTINPVNLDESYGGTSSDETQDIGVDEFLSDICPAKVVKIDHSHACICGACQDECISTYVVRTKYNHFLSLCRRCASDLS
jgi:hypothetical protein